MDKDDYKLLFDMTASLASVVAIIVVLRSWYRNTQKALRIESVTIYADKADTIYFLVVKNRKDYPIAIKSIICYTKKNYNIVKHSNGKWEYSVLFKDSEILSRNSEEFIIRESGNTSIKMVGIKSSREFSKLIFTMNTSHGKFELWCKNLVFEEMGKCKVYDQDHNYEYESVFFAESRYYWEIIKAFFKR